MDSFPSLVKSLDHAEWIDPFHNLRTMVQIERKHGTLFGNTNVPFTGKIIFHLSEKRCVEIVFKLTISDKYANDDDLEFELEEEVTEFVRDMLARDREGILRNLVQELNEVKGHELRGILDTVKFIAKYILAPITPVLGVSKSCRTQSFAYLNHLLLRQSPWAVQSKPPHKT